MATVNIVNVTSILPFTINGSATTSATDIIDVPADKLYKINTILIANIDGTNAADITIGVSTTNGSNYYNIASTISVPADSTLSLLSTTLYLDETDLLRITASANSDLEYTISGEILDDA